MRLTLLVIMTLMLSSWTGCRVRDERTDRIDNPTDSSYEIGRLVQDSVFDGKVHRYSSSRQYLGYSTYRFGRLDGVCVFKYPNGDTSDSLFFKNGYRDGPGYKFDTSGRLTNMVTYLMDRAVGDYISFDALGSPEKYTFTNFEGKVLYSVFYDKGSNDTLEFGAFPNYNYDTVMVDKRVKKLRIFIYLMKFPDLNMHYEIAAVRGNKILGSEIISTTAPFYETFKDLLLAEDKYAVIVSMYNKSKAKTTRKFMCWISRTQT